MGNTLPITSPPRQSPTRVAIFMEPQGIRNYLSQPWKRPIGRLQRVGSPTDDLPVMLDGVVTLTEFQAMLESLDERTAHYKGLCVGDMIIFVWRMHFLCHI